MGILEDTNKLETGLRTISAGIPYAVLLRIEAIGFSTFDLLLNPKPRVQELARGSCRWLEARHPPPTALQRIDVGRVGLLRRPSFA